MVFPKDEYFKMPNVMFGTDRRNGWIEKIGPIGFALYALVLRRYDFKKGRGMYESHVSMAKRLGMSEPTVEKHLRRLVDLGLVDQVPCGKRKHKQAIYVPRLPMPAAPEDRDLKRTDTENNSVTNTQITSVINTQVDWVKNHGLPKSTRNNTQNDEKGGSAQLFETEEVKEDLNGRKRLFNRLDINMSITDEVKTTAENEENVPVSKQLQVAWRYWCYLWEDHYGHAYYPARRKDNTILIPKDKKNLRDKIETVGFVEVTNRMERCIEVCDTIFPCFVRGKWERPITLNDFVNNHFFDQWITPQGDVMGPKPKNTAEKIKDAIEKRNRTVGQSDEDVCNTR